MHKGAPVINFNGAMRVETLVIGAIQVNAERVPAIQVAVNQTREYALLAHGRVAAEVYAYCFAAHKARLQHVEAYIPCYLVRDQTGVNQAVIAGVTWYVSSELRKNAAAHIATALNGEKLGNGKYPKCQAPDAVFSIFESLELKEEKERQ